ncbi:MAG: Rieske 2Fe-2S domain-containing protein [Myxococcota bacterium]
METRPHPLGAERYRFPAYANGWFRVGYSADLAAEQVVPLSYLGQQLVLFRTRSGEARLLDAYCPHLGAHLGVGGVVEGESIRCPFHAWRFDGAGKCVEVPYASRIPPQAVVRSWPITEKNGLILTHYDAQGREPTWEIPDLPQIGHPDWTPLHVKHWKVRARWLDMNENCVDSAHFKYVHGVLSIPELTVDVDGHIFRTGSVFDQKSPSGTVRGSLVTVDYGPAFQTVEMTGILDSLLMNTSTPIDEDFTDVSFAYSIKTDGDPAKQGLAKAVQDDLVEQFENDLPIWENKASWAKPMLCDGDGQFGKYRKWMTQFF